MLWFATEPDSPVTAPAEPSLEFDPRVLFAAERTLLAWIRTGVALMGLGFVVARFGLFLRQIALAADSRSGAPPGLSLWLGIALIGLGAAVLLVAVREHRSVIQRLNRGESLFPASPSRGIFVAGALVALSLVIVVYLFLSY